MALELPFILGTDTTTATIVLYGFMQQNILFGAFANNLGDMVGLEFLHELTTLCSMIGMLVLLFSPSLWKTKYLVSWIFLFVAVTLGGATGFELGYNFINAPGKVLLDTPLGYNDSQCTKEELEANNGPCTEVGPGSKVVDEALEAAQGEGLTTPAMVLARSSANRGMISIDNSHAVGDVKITGFVPQVLALYLANKLAFHLKIALYNLSQRVFKEKTDLLQSILHAELPDSQLKVWVNAFDNLCGAASKSLTGVNTATVLAVHPTQASKISNQLVDTTFNLKDAMKVIDISSDINKSDRTTISPIIDLLPENPTNGESARFNVLRLGQNNLDNKILKYYTVHDYQSYADPINAPDLLSYSDLTEQQIKDRIRETIEFREGEDRSLYEKTRRELVNPNSWDAKLLKPGTKVSILMPKTDVEKSKKYAKGAGDSLKYINSKDNFIKVTNCGELYASIVTYHKNADLLDNTDFQNQVKREVDKKCEDLDNLTYDPELRRNGGVCGNNFARKALEKTMSEALVAKQKALDYIMAVSKSCTSRDGNDCANEIDETLQLQKTSQINNALRSINNAVAEQHELPSNVKEGYTGDAYKLGKAFTSALTGPLAGIYSLGTALKAGAYSAILPIIKNILIAFILVLTPILFLLGLLVPTWAPGVIMTSIVALLFLQMTDVTMVLIDSVLHSVENVLKPVMKSQNSGSSYQAFLEVIWGMAYMASFAITAFLMFAAGNTKAIMSKLAGLDSTIKSTSQQIAGSGWQLTKAGASIAAGAATGGAVGGALGAKTANAIAGTQEFAALADREGFGAAFKGLGGTRKGNYAARRNSYRYQFSDAIESDIRSIEIDKMTGKEKSKEFKEGVKNAGDARYISLDNTSTAVEKRILNATKHDVNTQQARTIKDVVTPNLDKAASRNGVDKKEMKSKTVDVYDPETDTVTSQKTQSPLDKLGGYLYKKNQDIIKGDNEASLALTGALQYEVTSALSKAKKSKDGFTFEFDNKLTKEKLTENIRKSLDKSPDGIGGRVTDEHIAASLKNVLDGEGSKMSMSHKIDGLKGDIRNHIVKKGSNKPGRPQDDISQSKEDKEAKKAKKAAKKAKKEAKIAKEAAKAEKKSKKAAKTAIPEGFEQVGTDRNGNPKLKPKKK